MQVDWMQKIYKFKIIHLSNYYNITDFFQVLQVKVRQTSLQEAHAHCGDLENVGIVADVPGIDGRSLSAEAAVVKFHDLLTSLQHLRMSSNYFYDHLVT